MEWIVREGTQDERPSDIDLISSADTVYKRRNQRQVEVEDESGQKVKKWIYEEMEIPRAEYERQQNDLQSPLAMEIMQANTALIAQNELLQVQIEALMETLAEQKGE